MKNKVIQFLIIFLIHETPVHAPSKASSNERLNGLIAWTTPKTTR